MLITKLETELEMFERHLIILKFVLEQEPIGIMKLSEVTGLPKHKVRYSLRVLEHEGLIGPSAHGAVTTEKTRKFVDSIDERMGKLESKFQDIRKVSSEF
jgi:predicted transcriptional regulator